MKTGQPTARMVVGRAEGNKETIVWCVAVTSDMTVISGDSRGKTSFWNGVTGTLSDSIQSHKADVLTVSGPDGGGAYIEDIKIINDKYTRLPCHLTRARPTVPGWTRL